MKAFYFSTNEKKLQYGDGRVIRTGRTHKVYSKKLYVCRYGLHASERVLDALRYAPGAYLWLVELSGKIIKSEDKICASERTYLSGFNAEKLLREFARQQALINIEKIKPYCTVEDYEIILKWLKTRKERCRSAARSAAWSADLATNSAADSAARSAAWSAAMSSANDMLTAMIIERTGWNV